MAFAATQVTKITPNETLRRTQRMLRREWNLGADPAPDKDLRKTPPEGLGKNDKAIEALETPIEAQDFADVRANVTGDGLVGAELVGDSSKENLRDVIWRGIPQQHKA
jgi:hypothetical protein